MSKGSVFKHRRDGRTVRKDQIPKGHAWAWWTIEMMESPAYRALSLSAHRVIARIRIEFAHHGGKDNGALPVTFQDFESYGIHRHAIAPAIREAEALGFIRTTQFGRAGVGEFRVPNKFALTHLPTNDEQGAATNDWRKIETMEAAIVLATAARKASARFGKYPKKTGRRKQNTSAGNRTDTSAGNRTSNSELPVPETALLCRAETALLSISAQRSDGRSAPYLYPPPAGWDASNPDNLSWGVRWQQYMTGRCARVAMLEAAE